MFCIAYQNFTFEIIDRIVLISSIVFYDTASRLVKQRVGANLIRTSIKKYRAELNLSGNHLRRCLKND